MAPHGTHSVQGEGSAEKIIQTSESNLPLLERMMPIALPMRHESDCKQDSKTRHSGVGVSKDF